MDKIRTAAIGKLKNEIASFCAECGEAIPDVVIERLDELKKLCTDNEQLSNASATTLRVLSDFIENSEKLISHSEQLLAIRKTLNNMDILPEWRNLIVMKETLLPRSGGERISSIHHCLSIMERAFLRENPRIIPSRRLYPASGIVDRTISARVRML